MIDFFNQIKKKLNDELKIEEITLINNSSLHSKHKSFDPKKFHLKIIIKSKDLKKMNKIVAHKKIFSVLKTEMINKIHALEIQID